MNHVYKVPIIPHNLSKQETIIQVAEVLDHLSNVTDDLLKHINNRLESSSKKLSNISERVDKVNSKIQKLSGAKKATQVFSSCKYPANEINKPYVSIFSDVEPPELVRHKVKHKKAILSDEPLEKLHVYHVKLKASDSKAVKGLGEIPHDLEYVNDLLLYNSGKNLYQNFVMSDALDVTQRSHEHDHRDNSTIGVAPHSITERSTLTRSSTQNYFYTPNLGDVPALDVPLDLPDLPNIADDLRYELELGPGIAPSVITSPNIPDLPIIEETDSKPEEVLEVELPPPPPPPSEEKRPVVETEPELTPSPEPPKLTSTPTPKLRDLPQGDVRASLMDAIRKAGGTKNLKPREEEKESEVKTGGGGDLMADLHAKLSMRRKGISGAKKASLTMDATSTLGKISAMIPPPAPSECNANDNTEDEDWDD